MSKNYQLDCVRFSSERFTKSCVVCTTLTPAGWIFYRHLVLTKISKKGHMNGSEDPDNFKVTTTPQISQINNPPEFR